MQNTEKETTDNTDYTEKPSRRADNTTKDFMGKQNAKCL